MAEQTPLDFGQLRTARTELGDFTLRHELSIRHFRNEHAAWFYLTDDERLQDAEAQHHAGAADAGAHVGPAEPADTSVRHLTTTASCIESMCDLTERSDEQRAEFQKLVDDFAAGALSRDVDAWQSEEAAHVYCKVRALPAILDHASTGLVDPHVDRIKELAEYSWARVADEPRHQGIFEYAPPYRDANADVQPNEYPPNTFLTYWGLRVLESLEARGLCVALLGGLTNKRNTALLWSERSLGAQVALHARGSDSADPQQLAWAISTVIRFGDRREVATSQTTDILRAGLQALFNQQRPAGNFRRGEPLFHYPAAGNAYCYTLETLADLLHLSLEAERGAILRELLKPYGFNLLKLWRWAQADAREIGTKENPAIGWCSAHHPHRTAPESWATASGFHALQALRALIGVWAAESARRRLGVRKPKVSARDRAIAELADRADTWDAQAVLDETQENAAAFLASLFVNPALANETIAGLNPSTVKLDPDVFLIRSEQARSAILFGPPGTGKTTIVELLAGAIGWDFVEIAPSAFLAEGIDNVPKQADRIFQEIMELDRCVVLFDEADELIRDRSKENDPFGRFLTTSMLPKLAKLWEQRRVLFFLNTNWIDRADPAIKRSQRFDGAAFVLPPSFGRKKEMIGETLTDECARGLTRESVEKSLHDQGNDPHLGWFALMRFDQLGELKAALRAHPGGATDPVLRTELDRMGDQLSKSDWMPANEADQPFTRYVALATAQRRDFGRSRYIRLNAKIDEVPDQYEVAHIGEDVTFLTIPPAVTVPPATLEAGGWAATRNSVLWYTVVPVDNAETPEQQDEPPAANA